MVTEEWLEFKLRCGEELARRPVVRPTPPLSATGRQVAAIKGVAAGKRRPLTSISPVWRPARSGRPNCCAAAPNDNAHLTARPGPSNVAECRRRCS